MNNIYLLEDPRKYEQYARFAHVGTWTEGGICRSCGQGTSRLTEPLQIEWEPDSDLVGDFSWCGYTVAVSDNVRKFFQTNGFECEFGKVEIMPPTDKSKKKRVSHPYRGPELHWVIPSEHIAIDEEDSGVTLQTDCPICNQKRYSFRREGLVIEKSAWNGSRMFRVSQFLKSGVIFLTEQGLKEILEQGFSNIGYRPAGYIR
ncbi:MAG: hypothetical protein BWK80_54255 [Desulfobacteraceae bacterium IS3]|nr:MAG: hypothetical protein BWK80_54255 [Desulfobacteraceae bacterium IS3]